MIVGRFEKQPFDYKDYGIDYSEWIQSTDGDTLDEVDCIVTCLSDPNDIALLVERVELSTDRVVLWVGGGTDRARYKVTVQARTIVGRRDEVEVLFNVRDR